MDGLLALALRVGAVSKQNCGVAGWALLTKAKTRTEIKRLHIRFSWHRYGFEIVWITTERFQQRFHWQPNGLKIGVVGSLAVSTRVLVESWRLKTKCRWGLEGNNNGLREGSTETERIWKRVYRRPKGSKTISRTVSLKAVSKTVPMSNVLYIGFIGSRTVYNTGVNSNRPISKTV